VENNIDRRKFIKGSALLGMAGVAASSSTANTLLSNEVSAKKQERSFSTQEFAYNSNGKFKILQVTDTHFVAGNPKSERALKNMNEMLDREKPDLVIHTGDIIFGEPAEVSIREILEPISKRGIPFAVAFGNHDDEFDKTREELYEIVRSIPHSVVDTVENVTGVTNYALTLTSGSEAPDRVLYLFDSNAYSTIDGIKGYGHIHFDQIAWYREQSRLFAEMNNGKPVPSLAFFHIPLPEHKYAASNDSTVLVGTRGEKVCCPDINSGLFVSMKEMGDVQALFHGHDHNNDYATFWNNMFFIYGRFSGCDTVYNDLKPNGARVIELTKGEKSFRSWIRLSGGEIIQDLKYPDDFVG